MPSPPPVANPLVQLPTLTVKTYGQTSTVPAYAVFDREAVRVSESAIVAVLSKASVFEWAPFVPVAHRHTVIRQAIETAAGLAGVYQGSPASDALRDGVRTLVQENWAKPDELLALALASQNLDTAAPVVLAALLEAGANPNAPSLKPGHTCVQAAAAILQGDPPQPGAGQYAGVRALIQPDLWTAAGADWLTPNAEGYSAARLLLNTFVRAAPDQNDRLVFDLGHAVLDVADALASTTPARPLDAAELEAFMTELVATVETFPPEVAEIMEVDWDQTSQALKAWRSKSRLSAEVQSTSVRSASPRL